MDRKQSNREKLAAIRDKLFIDKYGLDQDIAEQPALYAEAAELAARTASLRDETKKTMEEVYAQVSLAFREKAKEEGTKITEDAVKQQVLLSSEYQEAASDYLAAKKAAEECQIMKDAVQQRGYMLRDMASLWIGGYFAEIAVKTENAEEVRYNFARSRANAERERRKNA